MAKRKKRRSTRSRKQQADYPGWLWMLFGLAIGLSVAFAVYVKDTQPVRNVASTRPEPASLQNAMDRNGEVPSQPAEEKPAAAAEEPIEERFDFYKMLPAFEMVIEEEQASTGATGAAPAAAAAIDEPGVYLLQAGSFSTHNDADRRRAELALHGIESRVQRASVNNRDYYRVYIGPIKDLDELNITRSRLRAAKIDVMRIRLGD